MDMLYTPDTYMTSWTHTKKNEATHDNNLVGLHGGLARDMWGPRTSH